MCCLIIKTPYPLDGATSPTLFRVHRSGVVTAADALSKKVRMTRLRVQEVKPVKEFLSLEVEVGKERIFLRNLSVIPDLRKEIVEL
jgi:hypothetical protein